MRRHPFSTAVLFALFVVGAVQAEPSPAAASGDRRDRDADAFFAGPAQTVVITIAPRLVNQLRDEPRAYVPAAVQVGGTVYTNVGIHLKGAAGSSRDFNDRPALTLKFDKFVKGQNCSGLAKLHLNNSVQDPTFLSESIASRLYRDCGVPTARSGHAFLTLNGRDLGLYVLKESYDSLFLKRNFPAGTNETGNLYDGGFLHDVDQPLERDAGKGPDDYSDLRSLRRAANTPEVRRAVELERVLDVDRFLSFLAIQALTDDWDGYGRNRNNYRLHFDSVSGRAEFIPHGMDQLFREVNASVTPNWEGWIANRTMELPVMQGRYEERIRSITTNRFTWTWLTNHLASVDVRLQPALASRSAEERQRWAGHLQRVANRLAGRIRSVRRQLDLPPDPAFAGLGADSRKPQTLTHWQPRPQQGQVTLETVRLDDRQALHLVASQNGSAASFRTTRSLPAGNYSFEASARTRGLVSRAGTPGRGAGIRISGSDRQNQLAGDQEWAPLRYRFELDEDREVEFILEIRADRGEAWFDLESLKLNPR